MGTYSDPITKLSLYKELAKSAGRAEIDPGEVAALCGLVTTTAESVGPALGRIAETFKQYTVHDNRHSCNLIRLMDHFIPEVTKKKLNGLEIAFLILAALLHDTGMIVSDEERAKTLASEEFLRFRHRQMERVLAAETARTAGQEPRAQAIDDALLAEYFRRLHPERAGAYITHKLGGRLTFNEVDLTRDLSRLCESHAWGFDQSLDPIHPEKAVVRLDAERHVGSVPLNLRYLSCCLRLADILDFDRSRTPLSVLELIDFSEDKSWEEWNKHLSVDGWKVTQNDVGFETRCSHPAYYVAVQQFLDSVDHELRSSRFLVDHEQAELAERYQFHLPHAVDRRKVVMGDESYVAGGFRFRLEYEDIMRLLMDRSLYPDLSLFLRELLQNALDACRRKEAHAREAGREGDYRPSIAVWDHSSDPGDPRIVFQDNGIGMSLGIVEQYFLRVGRSYYRSPEFEAERLRLERQGIELDASSQFGIGILSCFLVGDCFDIETYQFGHDPLAITVEGPTKYFVIRKLERPPQIEFPRLPAGDADDGPPAYTGTRITVHFRPGVKIRALETFETFAVNVDYPIRVYREEKGKPRVIARRRWENPDWSDPWDEMIKSVYRADNSRTREILQKILVPCYVPFEKWPFSSHLRGSAWLWLLRGKTRPRPNSGYLQIGSSVGPVGMAGLWRDVESIKDIQGYDLLRRVLGHLDDSDAAAVLKQNYGVSDVRDRIRKLNSEEREIFLKGLDRESLTSRPDEVFKQREVWFNNEEATLSLLQGSLRWIDLPVRLLSGFPLDGELLGRVSTLRVALHSILVPAGIARYSPNEGEMAKINFVSHVSGAKVDVRGRSAPTPAASRLFIPDSEGWRLSKPLARAFLYFACDLAAEDGADASWREWMKEVVERTVSALEPEDIRYCANTFGYLLQDKREKTIVKPIAVERRFGDRVPIATNPNSQGLVQNDFLTKMLMRLRCKVVDGIEYVNLPGH
jgi:hypothetical protein